MNPKDTITSKPRINSIDVLRGFALMGILLLHCLEHFESYYLPKLESPFWQWIDTAIRDTLFFLFQGKSYAIFSLLFGLSFFMQLDSQAGKDKFYQLRYIWRLVILFAFGYVNGLFYMGEWFIIYAMSGILLFPLYKAPSKVLIIISILLFLQIPQLVDFINILVHNTPPAPSAISLQMSRLFREGSDIYANGSLWDVLTFNAVQGRIALMLWFINVRYQQMIGLFIIGILIGRSRIYKDPDKMVYWSKKILPYAIGWFLLFYIIVWILPFFGLERQTLRASTGLFKTFGNLGMMMTYICGFTVLYYQTVRGYKILDKLAAVGRMSVTNYMFQSIIGITIFYGFGLGLANQTFLVCFMIGLLLCTFQIWYSNWHFKRFYYGPMEWLWRTLTWFKRIPMKRG